MVLGMIKILKKAIKLYFEINSSITVARILNI